MNGLNSSSAIFFGKAALMQPPVLVPTTITERPE